MLARVTTPPNMSQRVSGRNELNMGEDFPATLPAADITVTSRLARYAETTPQPNTVPRYGKAPRNRYGHHDNSQEAHPSLAFNVLA